MPCHEIRKSFDFARRFDDAYTSHRSGDPCQPAGHSEDQIGLSDGEYRWYKERKTKCDTPLRAKLRQRTINQRLLALQRFDQRMRYLQVLFQRKTTGANPQGGTHETNKI